MCSIVEIHLQEILIATNGFADENVIASGGFGPVYQGKSEKHGIIAVKRLDRKHGQGDVEFKREIALLSEYKHENIVSLIGFCDGDGEKILVYKHESRGSLDKHINSKHLGWIKRLQICIDAARGLKYLHDDAGPQHRILHRDVKSANILLDENWNAKISDFGLSRIGPANRQTTLLISNACGTFGYIDPEYFMTGCLTQKSDVYSFGVVLFEVLCGRPTRVTAYKNEREFLTVLVRKHYERQTLDQIIHFDLRNQINSASLLTFSTIAYQCLKTGSERPTMNKVVQQLQKALHNQLASDGSWTDDVYNGFSDYNDDFVALANTQPGSLASSSHSIPASSKSLNYDVFIRFRGEDVRRTFVDHLYYALARQGIYTYKDDRTNLRAKLWLPERLKAIEVSRIVLVVFSENYANSSWCLDELVDIMKCREERGQIIFPVFYKVDRYEVGQQKGRYGEAFSKHEFEYNNYKVQSWRKALVEAAGLTGFLANGNELARVIKEIVGKISSTLLGLMPNVEASANQTIADKDLIGMEARMQEVKSLLEVGSGGVHMVGICGMWGGGKSTLASSIYDEISREFEGCCFIKDVQAESRMHGLKLLQEKILSNVLKSKVELKSIEQGIYMMERRLRLNSVVIVLDDVNHIDHLKMLVGSRKWFGDGSRIIITTRDQDLLNAHNVNTTHNVRMLDDEEAIELFSKHAFGAGRPVKGYEEVSQNLVSKFDGHPSALISLGSFLHGKARSEWMRILARLEAIPADKVLEKFKLATDSGVTRDIFSWFAT